MTCLTEVWTIYSYGPTMGDSNIFMFFLFTSLLFHLTHAHLHVMLWPSHMYEMRARWCVEERTQQSMPGHVCLRRGECPPSPVTCPRLRLHHNGSPLYPHFSPFARKLKHDWVCYSLSSVGRVRSLFSLFPAGLFFCIRGPTTSAYW